MGAKDANPWILLCGLGDRGVRKFPFIHSD